MEENSIFIVRPNNLIGEKYHYTLYRIDILFFLVLLQIHSPRNLFTLAK